MSRFFAEYPQMRIAHVITRMILGGAKENTLLTCEDLRRIYPCRCGSPSCRGTLARRPEPPPPRKRAKPAAGHPARKRARAK